MGRAFEIPIPNLDVLASDGRTVLIIVMAVLGGAGMALLGAVPRAAACYIGLMIMPLAVQLLRSPMAMDQLVGALALLYMALGLKVVQMSSRMLRESFRLAAENQQLLADAQDGQRQAMALNEQLLAAQHALAHNNQALEAKVRERTERLEHIADQDALTGLYNRGAFVRSLEQGLATGAGRSVAVYFVDLDRFKDVNDSAGHAAGDHLLREMALRLRGFASDALAVARWGGDEFVVARLADSADPEALAAWGDALIDTLCAPVLFDERPLRVGASLGVAVAQGGTADELLSHADLAVYEAKQRSRGRTTVFRDEWAARMRKRHALVQALRASIDAGSLTLHYQPIVDADLRGVQAVEALLRWDHPEHGSVPPAVFVPLAEESGLILALGDWVLRQACRDAVRLVGPVCERIAVNVSVRQVMQHGFAVQVRHALEDAGLPPTALELELTESVFADDPDRVLEQLQALRRHGVTLSIDDFGTGYSSLAYLQRFPVDVLKVDRSFVRDWDRGGRTIVSAVISIARSLGAQVVIEGVETEATREAVARLGADRVQGWRVARPMPLAALLEWHNAGASRPAPGTESVSAVSVP